MNISKKFNGLFAACVAMAVTVATAAPSVTVGEVKTGDPWSTITVNYTLGGLDADLDYKVAFDVTAGGQTASITNVAAKLTNGATNIVVDTAALFGKQVADTKAKVKVSLIAVKPLPGVQLWEGGPYWAECNVGATTPEESGYHFWWGDTVGYKRNATDDGWVSAADGTTSIEFSYDKSPANSTTDKTIPELLSAGYIDSTGNLVAKHDAATAHLGAQWRMPTDAEFSALISNCDTEWTTLNGVYGRRVKGRGAYASKSIFLPAAGQGWDSALVPDVGPYWSSTPYSDDSIKAWYLGFNSSDFGRYWGGDRSEGQSVRPVRGFSK